MSLFERLRRARALPRHIAVGLCLAAVASNSAGAAESTDGAATLDAVASSIGPGWHSIPNTRFRNVMPKKGETEWGVVGPASVLIAWNNLAFDGKALYAHGGGHADYGGNEVYRFSLASLEWERLTEAAPYPPRVLKNPDGSATAHNSPARCPAPVHGPPSTHTYDGKFIAEAKLWVSTAGIAYCPSGVGEIWHGGLWAFDLVSRQWSRIDTNFNGIGLSAVLPDGNVFVADSRSEALFDPRTGKLVQQQGGYGNEGGGSAVYDPKRNRVWIANNYSTAYVPLTKDFKFAGKRIKVLPKKYGQPGHVTGVRSDGASAIDPVSGRLLRWSGGKQVVAYTPETDKWEVYDFPTGPNGKGPLYDRLFPLPGHDGVFIAVSNNIDENVWLLKLPQEPGREIRPEG